MRLVQSGNEEFIRFPVDIFDRPVNFDSSLFIFRPWRHRPFNLQFVCQYFEYWNAAANSNSKCNELEPEFHFDGWGNRLFWAPLSRDSRRLNPAGSGFYR